MQKKQHGAKQEPLYNSEYINGGNNMIDMNAQYDLAWNLTLAYGLQSYILSTACRLKYLLIFS